MITYGKFSYLLIGAALNIDLFSNCFPSVKMEQGTVTSLIEEKGTIKGVQYRTKAGEVLRAYAPLTIVCDGCFSNLRRSLCNPKVKTFRL